MKLSLSLVLAFLALPAQEKSYDLKLEWKPVKGHKSELAESTSMKMTMSVTGMPEPMSMGEEKSFAASEEVLSAEADGGSVRRWTFSKATQLKEGQAAPYSFQGKAVTVKHIKGKPREFTLDDGGKMAPEDLAGLKEAFVGGDDKPDKPSGADMFGPKKPVKVGESWSPDLKAIVHGMFEGEMNEGIDLSKSSCKFTLKSVETRAGVEFGKIEGALELSMAQMGPMKLDAPIPLKMAITLDCAIDGKLPDGVMTLKGELKGKSTTTGADGKVELDLNMTMAGQMTVRSTK